MQMDTGNFWVKNQQTKIKKKKQSPVKAIWQNCNESNGLFWRVIRNKKKRFEMIPITVLAFNKDHELLEIDVLKVDTTKPINSIKAEENSIELLKGFV